MARTDGRPRCTRFWISAYHLGLPGCPRLHVRMLAENEPDGSKYQYNKHSGIPTGIYSYGLGQGLLT